MTSNLSKSLLAWVIDCRECDGIIASPLFTPREKLLIGGVTHEMGFAKRAADRIIFMSKGEVVEDGAPDDFFAAPKTERARSFLRRLDLTPSAH